MELQTAPGGGVKGSTSAAFTVSVDASVRTVLELKQAIVGQHPELKIGGALQLQLKGQAGRGGRVTLPDTAQLATLDLEQRCVPGPGGARPEAALMVNQGPEQEVLIYTIDGPAAGKPLSDNEICITERVCHKVLGRTRPESVTRRVP